MALRTGGPVEWWWVGMALAPIPQVSALLVLLCQLPVHFRLDLGQLQLDPQGLGLLQLQSPLGCRVGSVDPGAPSVLKEEGGQGSSGSVSTPPVSASDLRLLQCGLELTLLPFQCLLGFLQFLDALPAEAGVVCELTDLLCEVGRAEEKAGRVLRPVATSKLTLQPRLHHSPPDPRAVP